MLWLASLLVFALSLALTGWLMLRQDRKLHHDLATHASADHPALLEHYIRRQRWQPFLAGSLSGLILVCLHLTDHFTQPPAATQQQPSASSMEFAAPAIENYIYEEGAPAGDVLDLFDPTPPPDDLEELKIRYENALTGVFMLHHCGFIREEDVYRWEESMRLHLNKNPETQALIAPILSAARGSWELFYHQTDCSSPVMEPLIQQFDRFLAH
jgi:hypothetical protein